MLFSMGCWAAAGEGPASLSQPCPAAHYPLPTARTDLLALSDRLEDLAQGGSCLKDAFFHAWRGAVLMALGRPAEAVEPLERALLTDPDLPGAQLDLAQALAMQGDSASAIGLLEALRGRAALPPAITRAIETQLAALRMPRRGDDALLAEGTWLSRWQLASLLGYDANLNNAPASSEITLTLPQGNVTLALDPSSRPRKGAALLSSLQWQGLRPDGAALWVVQGDLRSRETRDRDTGYLQGDVSAAWLQAPGALRQWIARAGATSLQFGGNTLLQAWRGSLQYQWESMSLPRWASTSQGTWSCRPSAGGELERRGFPSTRSLDGQYLGVAGGLLCRPPTEGPGASLSTAEASAATGASFLNLQLRAGEDRPSDAARAGGAFRKSEFRAQWEGPVAGRGRIGLQWSSAHQSDASPYSALLGNTDRRTTRHALQIEASWPLTPAVSVVAAAELARQRSNIEVFDNRQRSLYLGLRWEIDARKQR